MKQIIKKNLLAFIIVGVILGTVSVGATAIISSSSVEYKDGKSVNTALNEIYSKVNQAKYNTYKVGQLLKLKGDYYYVLSDSDSSKYYVTLLKAEPLTVAEVNNYGAGHINRYADHSVGTAYDKNGYGGMVYYSSGTCGVLNGSYVESGCTTDYNSSEVKYVVDAWLDDKFNTNELAKDSSGYSARLITKSELESLGYGNIINYASVNENVPNWLYNSNYDYWTMIPDNSDDTVFCILEDGFVSPNCDITFNYETCVRPVINVRKSSL